MVVTDDSQVKLYWEHNKIRSKFESLVPKLLKIKILINSKTQYVILNNKRNNKLDYSVENWYQQYSNKAIQVQNLNWIPLVGFVKSDSDLVYHFAGCDEFNKNKYHLQLKIDALIKD